MIPVGCVVLLIARSAWSNEAIVSANNEIGIAAGGHNTSYHEIAIPGQKWLTTDSNGYLDSEIGTQGMWRADVSRQGAAFGLQGIYSAASLSVSHGPTDYVGYTVGGFPVVLAHPDTTIDASVRAGRAFEIGAAVQVTPYVQYAFHRWYRDIGGLNRERYSHHEAGPGVLIQYAPTARLVLSADLQVGYTFAANVTGPSGVQGRPDFILHLGARPSEQIAVATDYAITRMLHLTMRYEVQHFTYGASPLGAGYSQGLTIMEPSSKTTNQAFVAGVAYAF